MRAALLALVLFLAPAFALADLVPTYNAVLDLSMTPQHPAPGDTVTIVVRGSFPNADGATYVWSVNNSVVLQGIGKTTLTLTAGKLGQTEVVTVLAEDGGAPEAAAQATIRPSSVDLTWEGKNVVPPFYIGRPLPNAGSAITIFAVPHVIANGAELPANSLKYTWSEDGTPLADQSGFGRSSVTLTPPRFGQAFTVSVRAETGDGINAADGSAVIQPQNPSILVYEHSPLIGVLFNKSVSGAFPFPETEISFTAFPLFIANVNALSYQWSVDGNPFDVDPAAPRDVTFRKTGTGSGSDAVLFSFTNPGSFIEHAENTFTLTF